MVIQTEEELTVEQNDGLTFTTFTDDCERHGHGNNRSVGERTKQLNGTSFGAVKWTDLKTGEK